MLDGGLFEKTAVAYETEVSHAFRRWVVSSVCVVKQNTLQVSIGSPYRAVFFVLVFSLSRTVDLVRTLFVALGPDPMRVIRANTTVAELLVVAV